MESQPQPQDAAPTPSPDGEASAPAPQASPTPTGALASLLDTPSIKLLAALLVGAGLVAFGVTALLVSVFQRKTEARTPFVRLVQVDEDTTDPGPWGVNWPRQYDGYQRTVDSTETEYGGSSAMPEQKLDAHPWLRRLFAGYAFSIDYRQARGHAYMLQDQEATERVTKRSQPGACLHCHASVVPTWRRLGLADGVGPAGEGDPFDWPAVTRGFELLGAMSYSDAHAELVVTPDGTAGASAHPVSCVDCHDPQSMAPRVTRPGFMQGIAALAAGQAEVPHLPSIQRWREGPRDRPYDPNVDASRQELRSYVCGQCHVEYYCGPKETLFFPWDQGLRAEQIESTLETHRFPDGGEFYDWEHAETGAKVFKVQHPEFELWSQGIHARSGVSCADCHMPYEREGAMKISTHWVRSPLLNINAACQTCHKVPEEELRARVLTIQDRTVALRDRAAAAYVDMLDAILAAQAAGASPEQLAPLLLLQRRAQWRLDFITSENSHGFHADQEAARILAEAIDYARQGQAQAIGLRAPQSAPRGAPSDAPPLGITPADRAPPAPYAPR
jgi:nitrite reductase (cytochrome c-552)